MGSSSEWIVRSVGLGLAAIALALAARWLIGRRPDRPHCPRCRYDAAGRGPDASRCPECGYVARSERDWQRRLRHPWLALLAILVGLGAGLFPFRAVVQVWAIQTFLPRYVVTAGGTAGGVRIVIEHDRWNDLGLTEWFGPDRAVAILPDGTRQLLAPATLIEFGLGRTSAGSSSFPPDDSPGFGLSVTGSRLGEVVMTMPTGGSGGYATTIVYQIDQGGLIPVSVLPNAWLEDTDHDGNPTMAGFDGTFAYVWTSGAGSTRPRIVLRPTADGRWAVDADAMRAAAPDEATLASLRDAVAKADAGQRELWMAPLLRGTIELLYAGRGRDAKAFLEAGWRGDPAELPVFEADFLAHFATSPYYLEIRALATESPTWP